MQLMDTRSSKVPSGIPLRRRAGMFTVTVNRGGLAVTVSKQMSLSLTGAIPLTGSVACQSKNTLTGYRGITAYQAWIQEAGPWILDSESRILEPGSRNQNAGSRIHVLGPEPPPKCEQRLIREMLPERNNSFCATKSICSSKACRS